MGFKPKDVKYGEERQQNTNVSGRQGWPLRQAWGNGSNLLLPGLEWEFLNFSTMGWDAALGPAAAEPGWVGKPQTSLSLEALPQSLQRGRSGSLREKLICHELVTPARCLHGCISPHVAQVTRGRKPCSHPWTASVELHTRVLASHQSHRVSGVDEQMKPLWSMDEKHMKYRHEHLFPAVLDSFSGLLMTRKIISGKEALTWPPFLERFLAHYNLCALR